MTFSPSLKMPMAARATTLLSSATATILFSILASKTSTTAQTSWAWNTLPLIGLSVSILWNILSFLILCTGVRFWFPRRFHVFVDASTALLLVVLGYLSFFFNLVSSKQTPSASSNHADLFSAGEKGLEYAGIVLLSISCIAHSVFFFSATSSRRERLQQGILVTEEVVIEQQSAASAEAFAPTPIVAMSQPPVYNSIWRTENPFEDAKSTRSLPLYHEEVGPFEHWYEGKEKEKMVEVTVYELAGSPV